MGFFSPFPRGTSSLSVAKEYLALSGGPDRFMQSFTCIALLGVPLGDFFTLFTRLSRSLASLSRLLNSLQSLPHQGPATPKGQVPPVWAVPLSLATTDGIASFYFPGVTEMFHFTPFRFAGL